jgi:hypothetical protein
VSALIDIAHPARSTRCDSAPSTVLTVTGPSLSGSELTLPANLDFRGPTPPFPAEPTVPLHHDGAYEVRVELAEAPLAGRVLGAEGEAHLRGLFAVNTTAPIEGYEGGRAPCGSYVDWYRPRNP